MNALQIGLAVFILVGCRVDGYYVLPEGHTLTVQLGGKGTGSVISDPAGLECLAGTCSGNFAEGTVVRLSAAATTNAFLGWTGVCRDRGACTVTMDGDHTVGALFGTPGDALWVRQLGSREHDSGRDLVVDGDGNLISVGVFRQETMAGPALTSDGDDDVYLAKLDGFTGSIIWVKRLGGTLRDNVFNLSVDRSNNIYIGGTFQGTVDFGGGPMASVGPAAIFVLKLDSDGRFHWARKVDGGGFGDNGAIATDGNTVALTSDYNNEITIDTTTIQGGDVFALKMSASTGELIWVKSFFGDAHGVALDNNGNVVLTGTFTGPVDFDGFLLKLADVNGAPLLSKQFGGSIYAYANTMATDSADNIFIAGTFQGTVDLGCTSNLTASNALWDAFLAKYSQAGACLWVKGFNGATGLATVHALDVNSAGELAATGEFCGSISFGGETLSSASACLDMDVFAARFAGDGSHLTSVRSGGILYDKALGTAQSADGRPFVTGEFGGFAEFGGSPLNAVGSYDAFIAAFPPR